MTALIAYGPIAFLALLALVAWVRDRIRSTPSVAEMVDRALDSGDALDVAEAAGVVAGSDLDWQLDLARIYRDYDAYRAEHRLPGESR
jgi:hypothetical protein